MNRFSKFLGKLKPNFNVNKRGQSGFSLIEIIIVIAIIGTLVGIIVSRIAGGRDSANLGITKTKANTLYSKLILYQTDHGGKYPTTAQGLDVLLKGAGGVPLATEEDLKDGWNNMFAYKLTSKGPVIISGGKDGQTEGPSAVCFLADKQLDSCAEVESAGSN